MLRRLKFCHSTFRRENIQIANAPVYVCMHERTFLLGVLYINSNTCYWISLISLILKKFDPQLRLGAEVQRLKHKRELKMSPMATPSAQKFFSNTTYSQIGYSRKRLSFQPLTISSEVSITLILTAKQRPPLLITSKCIFVPTTTVFCLLRMSLLRKGKFFFSPVTFVLFIVPPSSVVLFTKPSCIPAPIKPSHLLFDMDLF